MYVLFNITGIHLYCSHRVTSPFDLSGKKTNLLHKYLWSCNGCPQILKNKQFRAASHAASRSRSKKALRTASCLPRLAAVVNIGLILPCFWSLDTHEGSCPASQEYSSSPLALTSHFLSGASLCAPSLWLGSCRDCVVSVLSAYDVGPAVDGSRAEPFV